MIPLNYLGGLLILMGTVNFMDGLFSIILYLGKPSWRGGKAQTFWKDHLVRVIRMALSVGFILIGFVLL